jgi:GDP-L-fucose synthase
MLRTPCIFDSDSFFQFDTTRADGQYRKPASNKKLLGLMGGFEFTPFDKGAICVSFTVYIVLSPSIALDITVKWFLANYESARTGNAKHA